MNNDIILNQLKKALEVIKDGECISKGVARSTLVMGVSQIDVKKRILDFKATQGWLCLADEVVVFTNEKIPVLPEGQPVLYGELVTGADGEKSLHIRQAGSGCDLFEYTRVLGADGLLVTESFIANAVDGEKFERIVYETAWEKIGADESSSFQPRTSRFVGFDKAR